MPGLSRRSLLMTGSVLASGSLLARKARAAAAPLRIGYQKVGLLVVARQQRLIEKRVAAKGVEVSWSEFPAGPPLMEALNAGSIDFGYVGDTPPIFAQAAGIPFVYVAAIPPSPKAEAIIVKESSPIRSLQDLKGRRLGFTKASSSHNLTVAALDKAGIDYSDITPVYLAPADAAAAFASDAIDAWTIWDPFLAVGEKASPTRRIVSSGELLQAYPYLLASRNFASEHADLLNDTLAALKEAAAWADSHRGELAVALAQVTGVEIEAQRLAADRTSFGVVPIDAKIIAAQQATADRFQRLGLIPERVDVEAAIWRA
ncbi:sulfonate transport system substrate-binding protein [Arboricoccus pini]|uniref:Putative aliphatic sulfonates-binding protein n=1 Tax=Arboricoccus pini TaxID=1963835 RepID=A0A212S3C8_9PROT|nr:aliphatic sulfonate ABC transporter substrate-binding protein [Arboricoccus pini]SNB79692.1 sulfonate transport system substrate-binding protein [Arboricoccus pini]